MFDFILKAALIEHVVHAGCRWALCISRRKGELDAVIGWNCVDFIGNSFNQGHQESRGGDAIGFGYQLNKGKFTRHINGDIEMKLAVSSLHPGNIDVEIANRIGLELLLSTLLNRAGISGGSDFQIG